MTTTAIIEGLTILEKYRDKPGGFNCGAEHDILYAFATDSPVETGDLSRLVELRWFQEDVDCGDDDFGVNHYNQDEGWACFT